ncbi:hypothetical protein GGQ99_001350 [Aminobacter niigataensis]|uniref:Phosphohydrolase n=1 Tax=Aminobacter niigataensis TaxID=83265 RepID=A0ABR6KYL7_9HYPH|nr:hypothetical protein [Aminobacter niigataensis]MBB4649628.1 hypothetical protein [Aminobacter niigataensis]
MAKTRAGDWMQTFTGRQFWPLDPRPNEMFIEDIAHALSLQCRFGGHCIKFYSVAEHCVHLARHVSSENRLWALLHDASEAYIVDVPRPLKRFLAGYKPAEDAVMEAVCERFGLPPEMPAEVHEADMRIIQDERVNLSDCVTEWGYLSPPLGIQIECWPPERAKAEFLDTFARVFSRPSPEGEANG